MKIIVAVSGGIDSVVLLDMLARSGEHELVVAHFDHGMRDDSAADARFVELLAAKYRLEFVGQREELSGASEAQARDRRYGFLFGEADKRQAKLATAHHLDDLVETIALNVNRGTRWRGLASMNDDRIWRPLVSRTKSELKDYAAENRLEWVEDETNSTDAYSRNRIRRKVAPLPDSAKLSLHSLWQKQVSLKQEIVGEIWGSDFPIQSRYFMTMIERDVAIELLYEFVLGSTGVSLLTDQLDRLHLAIKVGRIGTVWQIAGGVEVSLNRQNWRIKEK